MTPLPSKPPTDWAALGAKINLPVVTRAELKHSLEHLLWDAAATAAHYHANPPADLGPEQKDYMVRLWDIKVRHDRALTVAAS